ncbi:hypothetical protein O3298_04555 [Janthinobacterium sp. SUN137]|nr:hypothetical protein [Janthinobacterium sp. SUN137]
MKKSLKGTCIHANKCVYFVIFLKLVLRQFFLLHALEMIEIKAKDANFAQYATMYSSVHIRKKSVSHVILKIIQMTMFIGITGAARQKSQKNSMWKFFMYCNVKMKL